MAKTMIDNCIYDDAWFFSLSADAKLLFFYLITNKACNLIGCYELPMPIIQTYTGLSAKRIESALAELKDKVVYTHGWVIIRNYSKHNPMRNPNIDKAKEQQLANLPQEVRKSYLTLAKGLVDPCQRVQGKVSESETEQETELRGGVGGKLGKYQSLTALVDTDLEEIATKYQVPIAFVLSKLEDMKNYCESKGKKYRNYKAALSDWVKRDSIKLRKEASHVERTRAIDASNL